MTLSPFLSPQHRHLRPGSSSKPSTARDPRASQRNSPRLPAELYDQVIDHLWNDFAALRACSLTCRAWLPSARFHLFHVISVPRALATSIRGRMHFEECPNVARYVHTLRTKDFVLACTLLHALPNVREVVLFGREDHQNLDIGIGSVAFATFKWPSFAMVEALRIENMKVIPTDFELILSIFPRLTTLNLRELNYGGSPSDFNFSGDTLATTPKIRIDELGIGTMRKNIATWLLQAVEASTLAYLGVKIVDATDATWLTSALEISSAMPKHLTVFFNTNEQHSAQISAIFSRMEISYLRSLTVISTLSEPNSTKPPDYSLVARLLSSAASSNFVKIGVDLQLLDKPVDSLVALNWQDIDQALCRMTRNEHVVVTVTVYHMLSLDSTPSTVLDIVERSLPGMVVSGVRLSIQSIVAPSFSKSVVKTVHRYPPGPA